MSRSRVLLPLLGAVLVTLLVAAPSSAGPVVPIEDYASYQPQTRCRPQAKPGTEALGDWMVGTYGGAAGGISRACGPGTSEHQEGRAFDWTLDAAKRADRRRAKAFLTDVLASDRQGNADARARRMGIMYIIWNDRMWSAWDEFAPEGYLSASCKTALTCSTTLRHRDHLHVSLTRPAGRGETSWYAGRLG
jgi:hypothetical protein